MIDEIIDIELDSGVILFSLKMEFVVKNCKFVNLKNVEGFGKFF